MSQQDWVVPQTTGDWLSRTEKRLISLERRQGAVGQITQIIGPAQNKRAMVIKDWNDPLAANNGYFWSRPGALHAPDGVRVWTGSVVARSDNSGMQQVWNTDDLDDVRYYMRTFIDDGTGSTGAEQGRIYSGWRNFATPTGFIELPDLGDTVDDLLADMAADIDTAAVALSFFEQAGEPVPGVSGVPATLKIGSVWVDTDDNRHTYSWDGDSWVSIESTLFGDIAADLAIMQDEIEAAATAAAEAMDFAEQLTMVYRQASAPTNPDSNGRALVADDVWFDSDDDNRMYTWTGSWTLLGISTEDYAADAATAAQAAAIAAAAIDASTKASAAQSAAISAAATDATTKAAAAQAAAIAAAATDATTKANAAQAAAIAAAATDASTKASAAQAAAIAAAAIDATTKAAAAQAAAIAVANTKNVVFRQGTIPTSLTAGDVWFDTANDNRIYRAFAAGVSTIGSSAWVLTQVGAAAIADDSISSAKIIAGSILTTDLIATAIDGMTVTGATLQTVVTAARGIKMNSTGLTAYDSGGTPTLTIVSATGAITSTGAILTSGSVTGAVVTGGTVQSEATAARGIKMSSAALIGYNSSGVAQFTIDAATGTVTLAGSLIGGGTITGPTFQTSVSATAGIKINSTNLIAYNASNTATFTITAATGAIAMTGPVLTGGSITGGVVTGGTVQSEATAARGIKITSASMIAYNSSGVAQVTIDAATGAITLAGSMTGAGTITGPLFQTSASANTGIKISSAGMFGYNGTIAKFSLNASTGILTLAGGVFSAGTIDGAVVTGGTLQSEATAFRGVKIDSAGIVFYDPGTGDPTLTFDAASGQLILDGSLAAMQIIGATVTGGILQTTVTAARGIKITSTGLIAYDNSGVTQATLNGTTGVLTVAGGVLTGGSITGGVVTGGTLQSEATTGRGIKINSSGLVLYAPSPAAASTAMFTLDAVTGAIALAGDLTGGGTITGPTFRTAASGERIEISGGVAGNILFYSGIAAETGFGYVAVDASTFGTSSTAFLSLRPPTMGPTGHSPIVYLSSNYDSVGSFKASTVTFETDNFLISAALGAPTDVTLTGHLTTTGTGWINLTLGTNITNNGSGWYNVQGKRVGNTIRLRGLAAVGGIAGIAAGAVVATIPTTIYNGTIGGTSTLPADVLGAGGVPVAGYRFDINTNRTITALSAVSSGAFIDFNNVTLDIV